MLQCFSKWWGLASAYDPLLRLFSAGMRELCMYNPQLCFLGGGAVFWSEGSLTWVNMGRETLSYNALPLVLIDSICKWNMILKIRYSSLSSKLRGCIHWLLPSSLHLLPLFRMPFPHIIINKTRCLASRWTIPLPKYFPLANLSPSKLEKCMPPGDL